LERLKLGEIVITVPAVGLMVETVQFKGLSITCLEPLRPLLRHYCVDTDVVVMMVDGSNPALLGQAAAELTALLTIDELKGADLIVLVNKRDLPSYIGVAAVTEQLGLHAMTHRVWRIDTCCANDYESMSASLEWLNNVLWDRHTRRIPKA
jgi:ADP-ribosylation factor protein 1